MDDGRRDGGGRWAKGQSGNPSGRPPLPEELRLRIRALGPRAVEALERALADPDPRVVVAAAKELLDRGYGRPTQSVELNAKTDFGRAHLEAMLERAAARHALTDQSDDPDQAH